MTQPDRIDIRHFSDVLCIWAHVSEIRVEELKRQFGDRISMRYHFIPVFGDAIGRLEKSWADRGGLDGYAVHVREIAARFPHVTLHPDTWTSVRPLTSATPHLFLKAVQLLQESSGRDTGDRSESALELAARQVRLAFFRDGRDISHIELLLEIAEEIGLPAAPLRRKLAGGEAMAAMCRDIELRDRRRIEGSPTFLLDGDRQKLYGNVGYRVLEANVRELLDHPRGASWC
jgi:hypothetical protein